MDSPAPASCGLEVWPTDRPRRASFANRLRPSHSIEEDVFVRDVDHAPRGVRAEGEAVAVAHLRREGLQGIARLSF